MRRRLLLLLSLWVASAAVAGGAVALGASSPARPSSRLIICPLSVGIVPCCGPPVTHAASTTPIQPGLCCPPNALCAIPLTIDSVPDPSTATGQVTVSGGVSAAALPAGSPVVLWQQLPRQRSFARAAQAGTDGAGLFTIVWGAGTVPTNRRWYVTAGGLRSRIVDQQVHAHITLAVSPSGGAHGASVSFSFTGHVSPVYPGRRVVVEQLVRGAWRPIARSRLDRGSKFRVRHLFTRHGASRVRAVLPGDPWNIRSVSPVITA